MSCPCQEFRELQDSFRNLFSVNNMGSVELGLLMKYGIPVAVKLLNKGKSEKEASEAARAIVLLAGNDVSNALLLADYKQTQSIIGSLYDVITDTGNALGGLLKSIGGLLK